MRRRGRKGIAILFAATMLLVTLPIVGLAIDAGMLFVIRERLNAAADSAAAAASRAASSQAAEDLARRYFEANFPPGYLGTDVERRRVRFTHTANGLEAAFEVEAPTYFMRLVSVKGSRVATTAVIR